MISGGIEIYQNVYIHLILAEICGDELLNSSESTMIAVGKKTLHVLGKEPKKRYLPKVNYKNISLLCGMCSRLKIKTSAGQWLSSDVFIVNYDHIQHINLLSLLLT